MLLVIKVLVDRIIKNDELKNIIFATEEAENLINEETRQCKEALKILAKEIK